MTWHDAAGVRMKHKFPATQRHHRDRAAPLAGSLFRKFDFFVKTEKTLIEKKFLDRIAKCFILLMYVQQIDQEEMCVAHPCVIKFALCLKTKLRKPAEGVQVEKNIY